MKMSHAGIVIGVTAAVLVVISAFAFWLIRHRRTKVGLQALYTGIVAK